MLTVEQGLTQFGVRVDEGNTKVRADRQNYSIYLGTMVFLFIFLFCLPFYLVRRADFESWSASPYTQPLSYAFRTAGENADVVIYGDSTAMHGIDPSIMSTELGVKVVNLPNTATTIHVVEDVPLRRYLAQNRPPKLIVFYFAPWDFDFGDPAYPMGNYEGRQTLARMGTVEEIWNYARKDPLQSLQFPFEFYFINTRLEALVTRPDHQVAQEVARTHGHVTNPLTSVLDSGCVFPEQVTHDLRFATVQRLGQKYSTPETQVLFVAAPIPDCKNAAAVLHQPYAQVPVAQPRVYPAKLFTPEAIYLHPKGELVPQVTKDLIDQVKPLLERGQSVDPMRSELATARDLPSMHPRH